MVTIIPMKITLLVLSAIFILLSSSLEVRAFDQVLSYTTGKMAFLVVNKRPVLSLAASYRGLQVTERIELVEVRLNRLIAAGFYPPDLNVRECNGLIGLAYQGDWLVLADPYTALQSQLSRKSLAKRWKINLEESLGNSINTAQVIETFEGMASWYGRDFHGRKTASGEMFNELRYTAAHRSLPFGSKVRVTNLGNKRSVVVVVNDRGPALKGRLLDLSRAAARAIGIFGVARVKMEVLETNEGGNKE